MIWSLLIFSLFAISKEFDVNYEGTGRRIAMTPGTKSEPTTAVELNLPTRLLTRVRRSCGCHGDPDDEPYLNLAVASGAVYLVTRDRDMLEWPEKHVPPRIACDPPPPFITPATKKVTYQPEARARVR